MEAAAAARAKVPRIRKHAAHVLQRRDAGGACTVRATETERHRLSGAKFASESVLYRDARIIRRLVDEKSRRPRSVNIAIRQSYGGDAKGDDDGKKCTEYLHVALLQA